VEQAGWSVGQTRWLAVRDCWRADNRTARAGHRLQFQLLLPSRNRPRRNAIPEFQPRHKLPLSSWHIRSCESETRFTLGLWFVHYGPGGRHSGDAVVEEDQLYDTLQQQHQQYQRFHRRNGRLTRELSVRSPASNQSAISDQSIQQRIEYFHDTVLIHKRSLVFRC